MPIEINDLETARFGIVAARIVDAGASPTVIDKAARSQGVQMLTVRIGVSDLPRVHAFEEAGYRLMDTLVYHDRPLDVLPPRGALSDGLTCRLAVPDDAPAVAAVARAGFHGYMGHYHTDPRLDDAAADAAYVEWAETSTARVSPEAPVLVVESGGRIVSFLTLRRNSPEEMELVLSAVAPECHGQGLYAALISEAFPVSQAAGAKRIVTSTQINNYAVQRVWSRLGFIHCRSLYTFHKWF